MILILAGTQDARELVARLLAAKLPVIASVVSAYGESLLKQAELTVNGRALPEKALRNFLTEKKIATIVDATHPYAVHISETAMGLAKELSIAYIRYERAASPSPEYKKLFVVADYSEAVAKAAALGQTVFLTIGSRNLKIFTEASALRAHTLIARVLPTAEVLAECEAVGLTPRQIIAMQGPFSHALNRELYEKYHAEVVVTKNSGTVGGTDTKLSAAIALHLPVVMIDRPKLQYPCVVQTYEAVLEVLKNEEQSK